MQIDTSQWRSASDPAQKTHSELDRRVFFLETLLETSRELDGLIQPKRIMDVFLLMTMGSLGIGTGLILLLNTKSRQGSMLHRGIPESEATSLQQNLWRIYEQFHAQEAHPGLTRRVPKILNRDSLPEHSPLPGQTELVLLWNISQEYCGLLGLGGKISAEPFEEDDYSLLSNLINILVSALSHALFTKNIQQLNAELQKQNIRLTETLELAQHARDDLDRRVHHLRSLYELTAELSPIVESQRLLEAFLLNILGTFGVKGGFALIYERSAQTVKTVARGTSRQLRIAAKEADKLFYRCLAAAAKRTMEPLTVSRLQDPEALFGELGLGINMQTAAMLVVDQSALGLVGLGPTLAGLPLADEEEQLFFAQAANFMTFFRNVRAFETIQCLNEDLLQANRELKQTIADLTEARHTIKVLERAKTALKGVLQRQADRIGRASVLDVSLILLAALILACTFNYANPHGISVLPQAIVQEPPAEIDAITARALQQAGQAVMVDARPPEFYRQKHIADSVNVPAALFEIIYKMKLTRLVNAETVVIVYGRNISRHYDEHVGQLLMAREHDKVRILSGGLRAWEQQGYPVRP